MGVYWTAVCDECKEFIEPGAIKGQGIKMGAIVHRESDFGALVLATLMDRWSGKKVRLVPDFDPSDYDQPYRDVSLEAIRDFNQSGFDRQIELDPEYKTAEEQLAEDEAEDEKRSADSEVESLLGPKLDPKVVESLIGAVRPVVRLRPPTHHVAAYVVVEKEGPFEAGQEVEVKVGALTVFRSQGFSEVENAEAFALRSMKVDRFDGKGDIEQLARSSLREGVRITVQILVTAPVQRLRFKIEGRALCDDKFPQMVPGVGEPFDVTVRAP